MRNPLKTLIIAFAIVIAASGSNVIAQASPLLLPPAVEKDLAARASDVTEVTLNKSMLGFASKFMNGKGKDDAAVRQLIDGLDGIYVRSYEFEKPGEYSMDQVETLRKSFETPEWSPMVRERERKNGETTDILVKLVNGEPHGMFILTAEPKELTIVLIMGPIRLDQLSELNGFSGLSGLGDVAKNKDSKDKFSKDKDGKEKDKPKTKDKKDGGE
jgi:hypothetical protein